ncbi:DUF397 domain-containing protein [Streptomyces avermitilis]|uniref:DUF397 domain-containing protein n=1 Tax=Streptomyces avermitilis TaxID=33903 RepID=UPI003820C304
MTGWQKSSFSGPGDGNECVELSYGDRMLLLRESDDPTRILPLTRESLAALLGRIHVDRT